MEVRIAYLSGSKLLCLLCLAALFCQAFAGLAGDANYLSDQQSAYKTENDKIEQKSRLLKRIQEYGGEPPASRLPLQLCEGDCDDDNDCDTGLVCFQRDANTAVPGCEGGENDSSRTDYCIASPGAPQPTPATPTLRPPTLRPPTPSPPTPSQPTSTKTVQRVGNDGSPSSVFPLGECQGDCDDDGDCDWGLYCFQRNRRDGVPGCLGGESDTSSTDYCAPLPPDKRSQPGSFRLKMYWEQGYFWQEETVERKWCATFDYDGYPGSGQCWYGQDSRSCNPDQVYISKCENDRRQSFLFTSLSNEEVLIKLGNGENKCWERDRRSIYLRTCDQTNPLQRWFAPNGSFTGSRFEISQRGYEQQCVSCDHHPKAGEVVELHSCRGLRNSDTSYWNQY